MEQIQSRYLELIRQLETINADLLRYTQDEADIERVLPTLTDSAQIAEYRNRLQEVRVTITRLEQEKIKVNAEIEKLVKEYINLSELTALNAELAEFFKTI